MTADLEKVTKTLEEISNPIVVTTTRRLPKPIIGLVSAFVVICLIVVLTYVAFMQNTLSDLQTQNATTSAQIEQQKNITSCVTEVQVQSQALFNDLLLSLRQPTELSEQGFAEKLRILTEANTEFPAKVAACQASPR